MGARVVLQIGRLLWWKEKVSHLEKHHCYCLVDKSTSKTSVCTFSGSLTVLNSSDLFLFADKGTGEVTGVIDEL